MWDCDGSLYSLSHGIERGHQFLRKEGEVLLQLHQQQCGSQRSAPNLRTQSSIRWHGIYHVVQSQQFSGLKRKGRGCLVIPATPRLRRHHGRRLASGKQTADLLYSASRYLHWKEEEEDLWLYAVFVTVLRWDRHQQIGNKATDLHMTCCTELVAFQYICVRSGLREDFLLLCMIRTTKFFYSVFVFIKKKKRSSCTCNTKI